MKKHNDKRREVPLREEGQVYARVTKMLGNGRLLASGTDGVERLCKIKGSMHRREWVRVGELVLVALRDFDSAKADVIFRYTDDEVRRLIKQREDVRVPTEDAEEDEDGAVAFADTEDIDLDRV